MTLTDYTTIKRVRRAAGVDKEKTIKQNVGTGDGITTVFHLRHPKIVSNDYLGTPASGDIYIYLNNSNSPESSSGYTIDAETAEVTFSSAPTVGYKIEATYWHSTVSDDDIEESISVADEDINEDSGKSFYSTLDTKLQYTQYWDGNGKDKVFFFKQNPLFSIQSISVDGNTTFVEDTDYYLYPLSAFAHWIKFESAPTVDKKNIIIIYEYGEAITNSVTRLSTAIAAQKIVKAEMARRGTTGAEVNVLSSGKIRGSTNRYINLLKMLKLEEDDGRKRLGIRVHAKRIGN